MLEGIFVDLHEAFLICNTRFLDERVWTHRWNEVKEIELLYLCFFGLKVLKHSNFLVFFDLYEFGLELDFDAVGFGYLEQSYRILGSRKHYGRHLVELGLEVKILVLPLFSEQVKYLLRSSSTLDWPLRFCEDRLPSFEAFTKLPRFLGCLVTVDGYNWTIGIVKGLPGSLDLVPVKFDSSGHD